MKMLRAPRGAPVGNLEIGRNAGLGLADTPSACELVCAWRTASYSRPQALGWTLLVVADSRAAAGRNSRLEDIIAFPNL